MHLGILVGSKLLQIEIKSLGGRLWVNSCLDLCPCDPGCKFISIVTLEVANLFHQEIAQNWQSNPRQIQSSLLFSQKFDLDLGRVYVYKNSELK